MTDLTFSLADVLTLLTVEASILVAYFKLRGSIAKIQTGNAALRRVWAVYNESFGLLMRHLVKKKVLTVDEMTSIQTQVASETIKKLLDTITGDTGSD